MSEASSARIQAGLCSVSFRQMDVTSIASLAAECGLAAIEWGADVHVPAGDLTRAATARTACADLGVEVASYGSYLMAGSGIASDVVSSTLDTAAALGAPNVRIWALGNPDPADEVRSICAAARERDLTIALEFHPGTRTANAASANALLDSVGAEVTNLTTYWQPDPTLASADQLAELDAVLARVSHLHVFQWRPDGERLSLADGAALWPAALARVAAAPMRLASRVAFLEFVIDDEPAHLRREAQVLRRWLGDTL